MGYAPERERQDLAVGQSHSHGACVPARSFLDDNGRWPVEIVERQTGAFERALPRWLVLIARSLRYRARDFAREVAFGTLKIHAARGAFVTRQAFLESGLGRFLELRVNGGMHRVGVAAEESAFATAFPSRARWSVKCEPCGRPS